MQGLEHSRYKCLLTYLSEDISVWQGVHLCTGAASSLHSNAEESMTNLARNGARCVKKPNETVWVRNAYSNVLVSNQGQGLPQ